MLFNNIISSLAIAALAVSSVDAQGLLGKKKGAQQAETMVKDAHKIPGGTYALYNPKERKYLVYSAKRGNGIHMLTKAQAKKQKGVVGWIFRTHSGKFSSIHNYQRTEETCLSAGWGQSKGKDSDVVMFACKIDKKKGSQGKTKHHKKSKHHKKTTHHKKHKKTHHKKHHSKHHKRDELAFDEIPSFDDFVNDEASNDFVAPGEYSSDIVEPEEYGTESDNIYNSADEFNGTMPVEDFTNEDFLIDDGEINDDAAADGESLESRSLEKRSGAPKWKFFEGKQIWLFIPHGKNTYNIFTAAHYQDMTKRCISTTPSNYYGTDATVLTAGCSGPNTQWQLQRM